MGLYHNKKTGNARITYHETRSRNHCCSRKAETIPYSECVSEDWVIQHAKRMRRIVICGLSGCAIYFHIISLMERFSEKRNLPNLKRVFWFSTRFVWNIYHSKKKLARYYHKCTCTFVLSTRFFGSDLTLNIPRGGSSEDPRGWFLCDPAVTISTNLLLIFVCVPLQLKINIM